MKEKEFISIIKNILSSKYIGDDCAYLKDLGIVITQDSLVENVHFRRDLISPYQLGYKSVMVNISDVVSCGAVPSYLTIALSLPPDIGIEFIEDFYRGAKLACKEGVEIVGGDITGSDKIYISVCAIGKTTGRNISSRSGAQIGQKVVVSGMHGSSAAGLNLLLNGKKEPQKFIKAHLEPEAQFEFGRSIGLILPVHASMDTSDGLMDALSTIANESGVLLDIDFDRIPYDKEIEKFDNWRDMVLFGGEDYQIVAAVPHDFCGGYVIGEVKKGIGVDLKIGDKIKHYSQQDVEEKLYNHF